MSRSVPGTYDVELGGLTGSFEVLGKAKFEVLSLKVSPEVPIPGRDVMITARITNTGDIGGTYNAVLMEGGRTIGTRAIRLNPGEQGTVDFQMGGLIAGTTHKVGMGGVTEEFRVKAIGGLRGREYEEEDDGPSGITLAAIVFSIAVIAFMVALIYSESRRG